MSTPKIIICFLLICQLSLPGVLLVGQNDFHLVKTASARENETQEEMPTLDEEEKYYQEAEPTLNQEELEFQKQNKILTNFSQMIDIFWQGQPRLIMSATDMEILKAHLDFDSLKNISGGKDEEILTQLFNQIKDKNATEALDAVEQIKPQIASPIYQQILDISGSDFNLAKTETNLTDEERATLVQSAKDRIFEAASDPNPAYFNPKYALYKEFPLDRRTLETLLYLVKPSTEGGAGHERIRVERIWKGFEQEDKISAKNHPLVEEGNVEPHSLGQALDIAEIDSVKCTLVKKKRLGSDKKIRQAPQAIKVKYQTQQGAQSAGAPVGDTFNDIFKNITSGNIAGVMDDLGLAFDLTDEEKKNASVEDLAGYIGSSFFMSVLGVKKSPDWKDMKSGFEALGSAYIEEEIGLPRGSFSGQNYDELLENTGRREIEDKLRLPAGSLLGQNKDEILANVGKKHFESQTKNDPNISSTYSPQMIDEALGLPDGSFNQAKAGEQSTLKNIGIFVLSQRISSVEQARHNTRAFLAGGEQELLGYPQKSSEHSSGISNYYSQDIEAITTELEPAKTECAKLKGSSKIAFPSQAEYVASVNRFGNYSLTGTLSCVKNFTTSDLPENNIIALIGLSGDDFSRIFAGNPREVFRHKGRKLMINLLKNSRAAQETEQQFLASHPEIQKAQGEFEVRKDAWGKAVTEMDSLDELVQKNNQTLKGDPEYQKSRAELKNNVNSIKNTLTVDRIKTTIKAGQNYLDIVDAKTKESGDNDFKEQAKSHLKLAYWHLRACLEGEYQPLTSDETANSSGAGASQSDADRYKNLYNSNKSLLETLQGLANGTTSPSQATLAYGGNQATNKLKLPSGSLNFLAQNNPTVSQSAFLISVGKAKYQEVFGDEEFDYLAVRLKPAEIDQKLELFGGATQDFLDKRRNDDLNSAPIDDFYSRIGREALKQTAVAEIAKNQLGLPDYFLSSSDIYHLLSGNTSAVYTRIAGAKLDTELGLSPGNGQTLFKAKNEAETKNALAQISADYAGNLLGIAPFSLSGNIANNMMYSRMEKTLGLKPNSVKVSKTLNDLLAQNGAYVFAGAFHIPLPFTSSYTASQFNQDLGSSQADAKERVKKFEKAILTQIKFVSDKNGVWWQDERDLDNLGMGEEQKSEIKNFQTAISQIDALLYIDAGSTAKLLSNQMSLADYIKQGAKQESNTKYLVRNSSAISGKVNDIASSVAESLGLESTYKTDFVAGITDLIDGGVSGHISSDKIAKVFSTVVDQGIGWETGTFSTFLSKPGDRGRLLTTFGEESLMTSLNLKFGLDDKVKNLFTGLSVVENCGDWGSGGLGQGCATMPAVIDLIKSQVKSFSHDKAILSDADASLIVQGDTRMIGLVTGARLVGELLGVDAVPANIAPSFDDYRVFIMGSPGDQTLIDEYVTKEITTQYEQANFGDGDVTLLAEQEDIVRRGLAQEKADQLQKTHQKNVQYKLSDSQLWKIDHHIPADFTRSMLESDENGKARTLADLAMNYIDDDGIVGAIFANTEVRNAVKAYALNPSGVGSDQVAINGLSAMEGFFNTNKIFGDIKIENGTFKEIFSATKTGNYAQMTKNLTNMYKTQWKEFAFSFGDEKLGLPAGTAYSLYKGYQGLQSAISGFKTAQGIYNGAVAALTAEGMTAEAAVKALETGTEAAGVSNAGAGVNQVKGELIALAVTTVINAIWGDKMVELDQKLELTPGSMSMVVGAAVYLYFVPSPDPLTVGIMIAMFVFTNLFGVYKVKLVCSADGYYPSIENAPADPALNLGLGVFDGMNPKNYQAGIMRASQAKIDDLISDMMDLGYHYQDSGKFSPEPFDEPDENTKPIQILTFSQDTLDNFFGTLRYRQVFNSDPPSSKNRQGIGISQDMTEVVHIGF